MDLLAELTEEIARTVREHPGNRHPRGDGPYFEEPLVGLAPARDPLFEAYKGIIGPFHLTPAELFDAAFGRGSLSQGTVICWVLPVAGETRRANRGEDRLPSARWARTRDMGERFNNELRRGVVGFLQARGHRAVAPMLSELWHRVDESPVGLASTWSERHAAYAAGLGTFSLNDGLITPRGIAHRLGSVVTDAVLPPAVRPYPDHRANCLFFRGERCGQCIRRCPAGALSEAGHDKARCARYTHGVALAAVGERYGVKVSGCGLCQTGVPCESRIPPSGAGRPPGAL